MKSHEKLSVLDLKKRFFLRYIRLESIQLIPDNQKYSVIIEP